MGPDPVNEALGDMENRRQELIDSVTNTELSEDDKVALAVRGASGIVTSAVFAICGALGRCAEALESQANSAAQ